MHMKLYIYIKRILNIKLKLSNIIYSVYIYIYVLCIINLTHMQHRLDLPLSFFGLGATRTDIACAMWNQSTASNSLPFLAAALINVLKVTTSGAMPAFNERLNHTSGSPSAEASRQFGRAAKGASVGPG